MWCKVVLLFFSVREGCFHFQCIMTGLLFEKSLSKSRIGPYIILLCAYTGQLCLWPCSLTKNISTSRLFKCLTSGKKSIGWLNLATSALEQVLVCYFHVLLISCVHKPCPTPTSAYFLYIIVHYSCGMLVYHMGNNLVLPPWLNSMGTEPVFDPSHDWPCPLQWGGGARRRGHRAASRADERTSKEEGNGGGVSVEDRVQLLHFCTDLLSSSHNVS